MERGRWENNEFVLKDLKKHCFLYLIQEIDSCINAEGSVQLDIKSNEGEFSLCQNLIFSECFSVTHHTQGEYISIQLLNNNKYTLQLCEIQKVNENLKLCSEQLPLSLDPGQEFHCFIAKTLNPIQLILKYTASPDPLSSLFQNHFTQKTKQHFEQSLHIHS